MDIYYFSATGNSLHAAKILKGILGGQIYDMKKTDGFKPCDTAVFVYPVHFYGLPVFVEEYISRLDIKDCKVYAIQTASRSNGSFAAYTLNRLLKAKGLKLSAYITAIAPNNHLFFSVRQNEDGIFSELSDLEKQIEAFVYSMQSDYEQTKYKRTFGMAAHTIWKWIKPKDKRFNVNKDCTACGQCEKLCPSKNIIIEGGRPYWQGKCTACMACVQLCPQKAINIADMNKDRYQNPYISVDELI